MIRILRILSHRLMGELEIHTQIACIILVITLPVGGVRLYNFLPQTKQTKQVFERNNTLSEMLARLKKDYSYSMELKACTYLKT